MFYVLPEYFMDDVKEILNKLNSLVFDTEFLVPDLKVISVHWDGDRGVPAGEIRFDDNENKFFFWAHGETLRGLSDGHS